MSNVPMYSVTAFSTPIVSVVSSNEKVNIDIHVTTNDAEGCQVKSSVGEPSNAHCKHIIPFSLNTEQWLMFKLNKSNF